MYEDELREIAKQIRSWLDWPDGGSMAAILRREQLEEWVKTLEAAADAQAAGRRTRSACC